MTEKTIVVLIGSPRGGEETWHSMYENLLKPYNADLAISFGDKSDKNISLYSNAKYVWDIPEYDDWFDYYKEHCSGYWEKSLRLGEEQGVTTTGLINFCFNHHIKNNYKHILQKYDRIILTRSDHFYIYPHPVLSNDVIWVTEDEDYGTMCDRFYIFPKKYIDQILGIVEYIDSKTGYDRLKEVLKIRKILHPNETIFSHNTESVKYHYFEDIGLLNHIQRSPRVHFLVAEKNDKTRWKKAEIPFPGNKNLLIKYKLEFVSAILRVYQKSNYWDE